MIVLMICGSQLKMKTFDYMPEMMLNLNSVPDHINYERDVYLYPYNGYQKANDSIKFTLHTKIVNTEVNDTFTYILFIGLIGGLIMLIVSLMKQGSKSEDREKKTN
jgi:hypothetical protein